MKHFITVSIIDTLIIYAVGQIVDDFKYKLSESHSINPIALNFASNWKLHGTAKVDGDQISLTQLPALWETGSVWNTKPIRSSDWIMELTYTSYSTWEGVADGMALWILPSFPKCTGWHYSYGGPPPKFQGLMVAIDTLRHYHPENLNRTVNQSAIIVVNNLTPKHFNYDDEGKDILLGKCLVQNRYHQTTETVAKVLIRYVGETLTVYHSNYTWNKYELCVTKQDATILRNGYLGVSAATSYGIGEFNIKSLVFSQLKDVPKDDFDGELPQDECLKQQNSNQTALYGVSGVAALLFISTIVVSVLLMKEKSQETKVKEHAPEVPVARNTETRFNNNYNDQDVQYYEDVDTDEYDHLNFNR